MIPNDISVLLSHHHRSSCSTDGDKYRDPEPGIIQRMTLETLTINRLLL